MPGSTLKLESSPIEDTDALTPDAEGVGGSCAGDSFSHLPRRYESGRATQGEQRAS